jgi:predicted outer membrane repeat protein
VFLTAAAMCPVNAAAPTKQASMGSAVSVRAANRGWPNLNLRDGHWAHADYRGDAAGVSALKSGVARPLALASADIDHNGTPDVVAAYSIGDTGLISVQRGNPDAFAPNDDSVFERLQQGYEPESLLPSADVYAVPTVPDFLVMGSFSSAAAQDIMVAANGGGLYLLKGDGNGKFEAPREIPLPGTVTSLAAGEFRAADGITDVAVGIAMPGGAALLVFEDADQGFIEPVVALSLKAAATAIEFGGLDDDPFQDIAVAAGNDILVVHGWGRAEQADPASRVERIELGAAVRGLATGEFAWDRAGRSEIAALTSDGLVHILRGADLDTRPFTKAESSARTRGTVEFSQARVVGVESARGWKPSRAGWTDANQFAASSFSGVTSVAGKPLLRANLSYRESDDLLLLGQNQPKLEVVQQVALITWMAGKAGAGAGLERTALDVASAPVAVLPLPKKLNGTRDFVVLDAGHTALTLLPQAPTATITVDRTDDPSGGGLTTASACTALANDCSLRGAIQFANANPNTTISLPASTYVLSINGTSPGGCDGNTVGDLGANASMTITGAGAATTIIRQTGTGPASDGDRVMCMNEPFTLDLVYTFSGITFVGGRDGKSDGTGTALGGGGIIGGEKGNSLTLSSVVFANNQVTVLGSANIGGGGIQITGGSLTITNSTFGGSSGPGNYSDRTSTTTANLQAGSGGGVMFTPSAPAHTGGTGNLSVSGSTFTRNSVGSICCGGGGIDLVIFAFASPGGIGSGAATIGSSTFSNNQSTVGNAGAIDVESLPTTVTSTSFTNNSAGNRGGAIYVGGGSLTLNGTGSAITFTGNTATNAGTSISTAGPVDVSGTNTSIGGSIEVTTGGSWTMNAGSSLAPTDVVITGGTFTGNNATVNIGGNLKIEPGAVVGATFNANSAAINIAGNLTYTAGGEPATSFNGGTSTFTFNGSGSQSISNTASIAFFNLTDSNTTQPLTPNNSLDVGGTLSVAANAVLAPVAAAVVGGSGLLTGNGTARVTRIAATPSFLGQYAILGSSLANLTIDYVGSAAQSVSGLTYGNLRLNNASGASLGGATTVNGTLMLTNGTLAVGSSLFTINAASSVGSGALSSAATGTVIYGAAGGGQVVIAANYGNLTFSNATKVLPAATIGIAGTFTPGSAGGHTITGSTIDFNGTGNQTVAAFLYNNLTISGARGGNVVTLANSGTIGIAGVFSPIVTGGGYVVIGSTVDFNGSGAQSVPAFNYYNLTISGARAANNVTFAGAGTIGVAGAFTPGAGFTSGGYVVTGSTLDFNGLGAQNIPLFSFNNLSTSSNRAGAAITFPSGTTSVLGAFAPTASNANYVMTGNTIRFGGSSVQTIPAFAYSSLQLDNAAGATLAGSVTVGQSLLLTSGLLATGANAVSLGANAISTRGTGYIVGNELKLFAGNGAFTFDVGTAPAGNYSPLEATVTAGTGTLSVNAVAGAQPNLTGAQASRSLQRYWSLTGGGGVTANLAFHYLDGDVVGDEGSYRGVKVSGGVLTGFRNQCPSHPCVDQAANVIRIDGVSSFSDWSAGDLNPDLILQKTHGADFVQGEVGRTYTLTTSNAGDFVTDPVTRTVTDVLPNGLTPTNASGTGWSCNIVSKTVQCMRIDALATGSSDPPITVTVNVALGAASVVNTAFISGGGDANSSNNSSSDPTTVLDVIFGDGFEL